jgi:hypothetical protein
MILRVVSLKVVAPHRLDLTFSNGVRKRVDVAPLLEGPIFDPLRSVGYFSKAKLDHECGTVVWPNGADFAPETLFGLPDVSLKRVRRKAASRRTLARGG